MDKKILKLLRTIKLHDLLLIIIKRALAFTVALVDGEIIYNFQPEKKKIFKLIRQIKKENEMLLENNEAYQIYSAVKSTAKISGDIAEVGVYLGGSARLICEAKGKKTLHLFDTFKGLPQICDQDDPKQFYQGQFDANLKNVKIYLKKYHNVRFYQGIFPTTVKKVKNKKFSFVHLDLDIYQSTLSALQFFYPKITPGGIIISHDYFSAQGVKKAFDKFFKLKPETIIELNHSQCLIAKI